jgi:hypothetical protein
MNSTDHDPGATYEIQVQGELDAGWQGWFDGFAITTTDAGEQAPNTKLSGPVADQAALRGMLCKLWDLNLTLLSVRRVADSEEEGEND